MGAECAYVGGRDSWAEWSKAESRFTSALDSKANGKGANLNDCTQVEGVSSLTMWGGWGSRFIVVGFCVVEDLEAALMI